jgi:biopolymer transport protein TolR
MKLSRRAQRMQRHNERAKRRPSLNLVALMDIFTILVFFLLVNSSDVQDVPTSRSVQLPESVADAKPRESVVVTITERDILLQGKAVGAVELALKDAEPLIPTLRTALDQELAPAPEGEDRGEVTVLGNRTIPYGLLKKVMATLTDAGFGRVSLAVVQKPNGDN